MTTISIPLTAEQRLALMHAETLTIEVSETEALADRINGNRNCHDVALGIMQLAMMNHEVIHIHVDYPAHVNWLRVKVFESDCEYEGEQQDICSACISFERNLEDGATPLQQLLELEDKLLELIAEAKDKAEA